MRFKQYLLTEKTFAIDVDVDQIYKQAFKKIIDKYEKTGEIDENIANAARRGRDHVTYKTTSATLKSKACQAAHALNPVTIECGINSPGTSYYRIDMKSIWISLPRDPVTMKLIGAQPHPKLRRAFESEISEGKLKATTYHELSHWLNDTLHNYNITKIVNLAAELGNPDIRKLGKKSVDMTHFEIDAQIHGIKAIKKVYRKEWDTFDINQVFDYYPSLRAVADQLRLSYGEDVFKIWYKLILKRMHREKLLGKNMKGSGLILETNLKD
jgi:hypothetical protein